MRQRSVRNVCARIGFAASFAAAMATGGGCGKGTVWSTRDEVRVGREAAQEVEKRYIVDSTSPDAQRVKRIGERLLAHSDARKDVPYSFKVLDRPEVNAVSLPGGPIYVFRGVLDLAGEDDDAVAAVIGHEIGHVNGRHIAHLITKELQASALLLLISTKAKSQAISDTAGIATEILGLKFTRDDEYDADRRGLSYTYKAGFDPQGMVRFFEKMQAQEKKQGSAPEFLRTHPLTKARIDRVQRLIESKEYKFGQ